jgi:hypothetical protein
VVLTVAEWGALRSWYGGGPAIQRPFIQHLQLVELYPLHCKVLLAFGVAVVSKYTVWQVYIRWSARPGSAVPFLCDEVDDVEVSRGETVASLKALLCARLNFRTFFTRLWLIDSAHDNSFVFLDKGEPNDEQQQQHQQHQEYNNNRTVTTKTKTSTRP